MNGHKVIYTALAAAGGVTALVSTRIYPDVMPDSPTFPAVTYQDLGTKNATGAVTNSNLSTSTFQVTGWAKSRLDAASLAIQIRTALDRAIRKSTVAGVAVDDCIFQDSIDLFDADTKTYYTHSTFKLAYRE